MYRYLGRYIDASDFDNQYFLIVLIIDGIDASPIDIVSMSMSRPINVSTSIPLPTSTYAQDSHLSSSANRGRGRGGRWGRMGRRNPARDALAKKPLVSHTKMELSRGDAASPHSTLMTLFDMDGAPSFNMADSFRVEYGPPPARRRVCCLHPLPTFSPPHSSTPLAISGIRHPHRKGVSLPIGALTHLYLPLRLATTRGIAE
jgi:hypothetical protein